MAFFPPQPSSSNNDDHNKVRALNQLKTTFILGLSIGLVGLLAYPLSIDGIRWHFASVMLLLGAACLMSGFFTGFLFGIPKANQQNDAKYQLNNSLSDIAEWLTKIIVGLGLVQLGKIPGYLMSLSKYISMGMTSSIHDESAFISCAIVYFIVFGLYFGYNYMRLFLTGEFIAADQRMNPVAVVNNPEALLKNAKNDINTTVLKLAPEAISNDMFLEQMPDKESIAKINKFALLSALQNAAHQKLMDGQKLNPHDPQKNRWGGIPERDGRCLSAIVKAASGSKNFYNVSITLKATDPTNPLTEGEDIIFGIHDTFPSPIKSVPVTNGKAVLELVAYGAFTVGCFADGGKTELELDLSTLADAPKEFREN